MKRIVNAVLVVAVCVSLTACMAAPLVVQAARSANSNETAKSARASDAGMATAVLSRPITPEEFFAGAKKVVVESGYQMNSVSAAGRSLSATKQGGDSGMLGIGRTVGVTIVTFTLDQEGRKVEISVTTRGSAADNIQDVTAKMKAGLEQLGKT